MKESINKKLISKSISCTNLIVCHFLFVLGIIHICKDIKFKTGNVFFIGSIYRRSQFGQLETTQILMWKRTFNFKSCGTVLVLIQGTIKVSVGHVRFDFGGHIYIKWSIARMVIDELKRKQAVSSYYRKSVFDSSFVRHWHMPVQFQMHTMNLFFVFFFYFHCFKRK